MAYALITGASSGIGLAITRLLAFRGYDIIMVARDIEKLNSVKEELENVYGVNIVIVSIDLFNVYGVKELFDLVGSFDIDILINNAGTSVSGQHIDIEIEEIENMLNINIIAVTLLCRLFAAEMKKKKKKGYIMNIASIAAYRPLIGMAAYSASKRYILNFSDALGVELKDFNISVTCVCPGSVDTKLFHANFLRKTFPSLFFANMISKSDFVAKIAVDAMMSEKQNVIVGGVFKIAVFVVCVFPKNVFIKLMKTLIDSRARE